MSYFGQHKHRYSPQMRRVIECRIADAARAVGQDSQKAMEYRKVCRTDTRKNGGERMPLYFKRVARPKLRRNEGLARFKVEDDPDLGMGITERMPSRRKSRAKKGLGIGKKAKKLTFGARPLPKVRPPKVSKRTGKKAPLLGIAQKAKKRREASQKEWAQQREHRAAIAQYLAETREPSARKPSARKPSSRGPSAWEEQQAHRAAVAQYLAETGAKKPSKRGKTKPTGAEPMPAKKKPAERKPAKKAPAKKAAARKPAAKKAAARKPAAKKAPAKKAPARKAAAKKRPKSGSPAKRKVAKKKHQVMVGGKRVITPSLRKKIKAGQKKYWKKVKAGEVQRKKPAKRKAKAKATKKVKKNYSGGYRRNAGFGRVLTAMGKPILVGAGGYAAHRIGTSTLASLLGSIVSPTVAKLVSALAVAIGGGYLVNKFVPKHSFNATLGMGLSAFGIGMKELLPDFAEYAGFGNVQTASLLPRYSLGQYYQAAAGDPFLQAAAGDPFLQAAAGEYFTQPQLGEYFSQDIFQMPGAEGNYGMSKIDVQGDTGAYEFHQSFDGVGAAPVDEGISPNANMDQAFNFMEAAAGVGPGAASRSTYVPQERALPAGARSTQYEEGIFDQGGIFAG
jgi:hypothetical protein